MKKLPSISLVTFIILFVFGAIAHATSVVPNINENIGAFITFLIESFQGGNWYVVGGLVIMLTVWLIGKFTKVGANWLPVINAGVGMLAGLVVGLANPETAWYKDIYFGVLSSGPAALFWSTFGKKLFPIKIKE